MKKMIMAIVLIAASFSMKAQTPSPVPEMNDGIRELNSEYFLFKKELNDFLKDYKIKNEVGFTSLLTNQSNNRSVVLANRFISFSSKLNSFILKHGSSTLPWCSLTCGVYTGACMSSCNQHPMGSPAYVSCMSPCIYYSWLCSDFCADFPNGVPPPPPSGY